MLTWCDHRPHCGSPCKHQHEEPRCGVGWDPTERFLTQSSSQYELGVIHPDQGDRDPFQPRVARTKAGQPVSPTEWKNLSRTKQVARSSIRKEGNNSSTDCQQPFFSPGFMAVMALTRDPQWRGLTRGWWGWVSLDELVANLSGAFLYATPLQSHFG